MRFSTLKVGHAALSITGAPEATRPPAAVGHYELVSVNGQPVPIYGPPSMGFAGPLIPAGNLVLRTDGTYSLGLQGLEQGKYAVDGSRLLMHPTCTAGGTCLR